jgi:hypothetical protein
VVYLARKAEGEAPLRRFVDSYLRHPAALGHDLIVIYKGYEQTKDLTDAREIFRGIPHTGIELSDAGFDIGAYLVAARKLGHEYLCFVNTFTEIAGDGWLQALYRHASLPVVGIAGAMGSYESLHSTLKLSHEVRWLCNEAAINYDPRLDHYFEFVTTVACKAWRARGRGEQLSAGEKLLEFAKTLGWRLRSSESARDYFRPINPGTPLDEQFERRWNVLVSPGGYLEDYAQIRSFPNPHLRSNGFMLARHRLLELGFDTPETKMQACLFESGKRGLTSRFRENGLGAIVVGKDGRGFDVQDWFRSNTYRLGDQSNLLVTDNQTRRMPKMSAGARFTHMRLAWGDYAGAAPKDYPNLGISLSVVPAATEGPRVLFPSES